MIAAAVDLHVHSTASDGALAPSDVVALAADREVRVLALTDHDTLGGVDEARTAGRDHDVHVLTGIELSARYHGGQCHLLAWLPAEVPAGFRARIDELGELRRDRARLMVERLGTIGVDLSWEDVERVASGTVGRPHVAEALVRAGHADSRADAFARWIGEDGPAYVPSGKLDPEDAVRLAAEAGALVSLAHPRTLRLDDEALAGFVGRLADAGLGAVEAHRGDQPPERQAAYARIAARHGLLVSTGSDFHSPAREGRDPRRLGFVDGPGIAPDALDALLSRLPGAPAALAR